MDTVFAPAYSILSIDGGGIRGIIPCRVLMYIEEKFAQHQIALADLFDLMAGTSTGGILACGLNIRDEDGKARYKAADLIGLYRGEEGKKIFAQPKIGPLKPLRSWFFRSKFPQENIETILQRKFGDAMLSDSITDLLITSYNIQQKTPFYFRSSEAIDNPEIEDFPMWKIARATSAAPTYFPPFQTEYSGNFSRRDRSGHRVTEQLDSIPLIDGGVFANNPSLLAYIEAKNKWKSSAQYQAMLELFKENMALAIASGRGMSAEVKSDNYEAPFLLLSIGTGQSRRPYPYEKAKKWGMLQWAKPSIDILMQGVSQSVHYQMKYLLPPFGDPEQTPRYVRINIELDPKHSEMDDASKENTDRLYNEYGDRIIENNQEALDRVCNLLAEIYWKRQERLAT